MGTVVLTVHLYCSGCSNITMYLYIAVGLHLVTVASGLQCYTCESSKDGCDATPAKPGNLTTCTGNTQATCFITQMLSDDKVTVRRGCSADSKEDKCETHHIGNTMYTYCNCGQEGCNKDWSQAAGPPLQCYTCSSNEGQCDDRNTGTLVECPIEKRKGCFISWALYGEAADYMRGCIEVTDPSEYQCKDIGSNGETLHYCDCHGDGCNQNFATAGECASTTSNTTTTVTTTSTKTTTTTSTTTTSAGSGLALVSIPALILILIPK